MREIIRGALHAEGVRCILDGLNVAELPSSITSVIKVLVPAGHADHAHRFLEAHETRRHPS